MIIKLSPVRHDDVLTVFKNGDALIVNGELLDFTPLPEGATLPATAISNQWVSGEVTREGGELIITLILPIPQNYSQEQAFPVPLSNLRDGVVEFPKPLEVSDE